MASDEELADLFADPGLPLAGCSGTWSHVARYRHRHTLLDAAGARHADGRFHPALLRVPALYLSRSPVTALLETRAIVGDIERNAFDAGPPIVMVSVNVELRAVLDLTCEDVLAMFRTNYQEVTGNWTYDELPGTWRLGIAAYASGVVTGIRYPSARAGTTQLHDNLVVFPDRVRHDATSRLYAYDPDGDLASTVANIRPRRAIMRM